VKKAANSNVSYTEQYMRRRQFKARLAVIATALAILLGFSVAYLTKADTVDGRRIVIIDGDTIDAQGERIRILNIDAPESFRSRCEAELKLALRTKERLADLLRSGPVEIKRQGQDRYRRTLATLSVREGDVGNILVRERLALPWQDGRAAKEERLQTWCGPRARLLDQRARLPVDNGGKAQAVLASPK
jgi:endonuclease YncB( thermonuclease family)